MEYRTLESMIIQNKHGITASSYSFLDILSWLTSVFAVLGQSETGRNKTWNLITVNPLFDVEHLE